MFRWEMGGFLIRDSWEEKKEKNERKKEGMQSVVWMSEILNSALTSDMALGHASAPAAFIPLCAILVVGVCQTRWF